MIKHYLVLTLRHFWKNKLHNLISVLGISLSLAFFALCMNLVREFTNMDKNYPDAERMFTLVSEHTSYPFPYTFISEPIRNDFPEVETCVTTWFHESEELFYTSDAKGIVQAFHLQRAEADPQLFDLLHLPFVVSPHEGYQDEPNGVLLTESAARRIYGTTDVIGMLLTRSDTYFEPSFQPQVPAHEFYTVRGVIKDFPGISYFSLSGLRDAIFINDVKGHLNPDGKANYFGATTVIKLHPGVSVDAFKEKIRDYKPVTINESVNEFIRRGQDSEYLALVPFSETFTAPLGIVYTIVRVFLSLIACLVLFVSIFNYVPYVISLFMSRVHECAIRKSVNASFWQLYVLFYAEIALTFILAGVLSIYWGQLIGGVVNSLIGEYFSLDTSHITNELVQYLITGLLLAFLILLIPVRKINSNTVKASLYGGKSRKPRSKTRIVLLGLQLFIACIFLSATVILYLHLDKLSDQSISSLSRHERECIVELDLSAHILKDHRSVILDRFKSNPYIEELLLTNTSIVDNEFWVTDLSYGGEPLDYNKYFTLGVGNNYASFTKAELLEGREPQVGSGTEIIINESAKRLLGDGSVLGASVASYNRTYTIVGVIKDNQERSSIVARKELFYLPLTDGGFQYVYLRIAPEQTRQTLQFIDRTVREFLPETINYTCHTLNERISVVNVLEEGLFKLFLACALTSILISLFGVYSSVLLTVERRRKEVALRKINGAELTDIVRMFLRTYFWVLVVAALPAFTIVYLASTIYLALYPDAISLSVWLFVWVFLLLLLLLVGTIISQLIKVARVNPAEVIKAD